MPEPTYLSKVTAFVTRPGASGLDLLLFQHPNAGIQFPAGTVEEDETPEQAVLREVAEETGLTQTRIIRYIGCRDELPPGFTHVVLRHTKVYARPDPNSFDWADFYRGIPVRLLRREGDFAQVIYEEGDRYPDPTYTTYTIMGWVPENCLGTTNRRHFFHLALTGESLALTGESPERWSQASDKHIFQPFWAPLTNLPEIIAFQRAWLDFARDEMGYRFE